MFCCETSPYQPALWHCLLCHAVLCFALPCDVRTRGKAGKLQGNLAGCLAVLKGTPTTYNKDLQEVGDIV
jgi:hypothetical protein